MLITREKLITPLFWRSCLCIKYSGIVPGPSMFAFKAKIYGVLYNQASSVALVTHLVIGQR